MLIFVIFLFLLVSGVGCGLWLWHSLDFYVNHFVVPFQKHGILFAFVEILFMLVIQLRSLLLCTHAQVLRNGMDNSKIGWEKYNVGTWAILWLGGWTQVFVFVLLMILPVSSHLQHSEDYASLWVSTAPSNNSSFSVVCFVKFGICSQLSNW